MNHIFAKELEHLINKHSMERGSDTQDFILATYLCDCLRAFNSAADLKFLKNGQIRVKLSLLIEDRPYQPGNCVPMEADP